MPDLEEEERQRRAAIATRIARLVRYEGWYGSADLRSQAGG